MPENWPYDKSTRPPALVRPCPCCESAGCLECGGTGQRVTTHLDAGDGITMRVQGDKPLTAASADALRAVGRAAVKASSARFFFAVVADDDEVQSTHPAHAPAAALVGLANAEGEEREATDFPRTMRVERWYYSGWPNTGEITRREPVDPAALEAAA